MNVYLILIISTIFSTFLRKNSTISKKISGSNAFNFRGMYNQRYHQAPKGHLVTSPVFRVRLTVGSIEVTGEGSTAQAAKHSAATNALLKLKVWKSSKISWNHSKLKFRPTKVLIFSMKPAKKIFSLMAGKLNLIFITKNLIFPPLD